MLGWIYACSRISTISISNYKFGLCSHVFLVLQDVEGFPNGNIPAFTRRDQIFERVERLEAEGPQLGFCKTIEIR